MMKISIQKFFNLSLLSLSAFCVLIPSVQAATPSSASLAAPAAEFLLAQVTSCPGSVHVATFFTATRQISICQGPDEFNFLRSMYLEDSDDNVFVMHDVTYDEQSEWIGFNAISGYVTYAIDTESLTIWEDGVVVVQEEVVNYSIE
jgi:hypothetical protein